MIFLTAGSEGTIVLLFPYYSPFSMILYKWMWKDGKGTTVVKIGWGGVGCRGTILFFCSISFCKPGMALNGPILGQCTFVSTALASGSSWLRKELPILKCHTHLYNVLILLCHFIWCHLSLHQSYWAQVRVPLVWRVTISPVSHTCSSPLYHWSSLISPYRNSAILLLTIFMLLMKTRPRAPVTCSPVPKEVSFLTSPCLRSAFPHGLNIHLALFFIAHFSSWPLIAPSSRSPAVAQLWETSVGDPDSNSAPNHEAPQACCEDKLRGGGGSWEEEWAMSVNLNPSTVISVHNLSLISRLTLQMLPRPSPPPCGHVELYTDSPTLEIYKGNVDDYFGASRQFI